MCLSSADSDNEHHGLKKTIEAFNDGGVLDVPKLVEFTTQTEESLFLMAAKGELFDNFTDEEDGGGGHDSHHSDEHGVQSTEGETERGAAKDALPASVQAVAEPQPAPGLQGAPQPRLGGRKASLKMITPRKRVEHGGYTFLTDGAGDVELTARGGNHPGGGTQSGGGEAVNPMWGQGQDGAAQGPFQLPGVLPSWATTMFHSAEK